MDKVIARKLIFVVILVNSALLALGAVLQYIQPQSVIVFGDWLYFIAFLILPFSVTAVVYNKWKELSWGGLGGYVLLLIGSTFVASYQLLQTWSDSGIAQAKLLLSQTLVGIPFNLLGLVIIALGLLLISITMFFASVYRPEASRLILLGCMFVVLSEFLMSLWFLWPLGVVTISLGLAFTSLDFWNQQPETSSPKKRK